MKTIQPRLLAAQCRAIPVTLSLVMANVLVHGLLAAIDNRAFDALGYERFLVQWGANVPGLTLSGEWWRLGSSVFLHAGVMHLLVNCAVLFEIGRCVEPRFGSLRMLVLYLLSGLGGSLASATWHTLIVSAGASGAIFGLIGAMVVFGFGAPGRLCNSAGQTISPKRLLTSVGLTLVLGLFLKFDNVAHGGGLAVGSILAASILLSEKWGRASTPNGAFAATALVVALVLVGGARLEYRPELARQLRFAQLLDEIRNGSADLRQHLRRCTEDGLQGGPTDYQQRTSSCLKGTLDDAAGSESELVPLLKSAYEIWIALNVRSVWPLCQKRAGQLERLAQNPTQRQGFTLAREYCQARLQLEAAIFAAKPVELPVQRLSELFSRYDAVFGAIQDGNYTSPVFSNEDEVVPLVQHPAGAPPDPVRKKDDELATTMMELARSITPEVEAYASLDRCAYMTCYRPWAARLFDGDR